MSQVVLVRPTEVSELTVDPTGTSLHEAILRVKLGINILLDHQLSIGLVLSRIRHVLGEKPKSVEQSLSMTEIF